MDTVDCAGTSEPQGADSTLVHGPTLPITLSSSTSRAIAPPTDLDEESKLQISNYYWGFQIGTALAMGIPLRSCGSPTYFVNGYVKVYREPPLWQVPPSLLDGSLKATALSAAIFDFSVSILGDYSPLRFFAVNNCQVLDAGRNKMLSTAGEGTHLAIHGFRGHESFVIGLAILAKQVAYRSPCICGPHLRIIEF
ncbi:hypothetical protein BDQ17DRAFT_1422410 [Cyathus striatus]|nr:hypothetical protein BDQ17DRAFT_1422410 [Cyathus striatus]